jgi:hypothetical protein
MSRDPAATEKTFVEITQDAPVAVQKLIAFLQRKGVKIHEPLIVRQEANVYRIDIEGKDGRDEDCWGNIAWALRGDNVQVIEVQITIRGKTDHNFNFGAEIAFARQLPTAPLTKDEIEFVKSTERKNDRSHDWDRVELGSDLAVRVGPFPPLDSHGRVECRANSIALEIALTYPDNLSKHEIYKKWKDAHPKGSIDRFLFDLGTQSALNWTRDLFALELPAHSPKGRWQYVDNRPAKPITAEQIDRFLDFLAGQLDVASEVSFSPGELFRVVEPGDKKMTFGDAEQLAFAVWDQARTLMQLANDKKIDLTDAHKQRIHVIGHFVHWISQRRKEMALAIVTGRSVDTLTKPPIYKLSDRAPTKVPPPPLQFISGGEDPDVVFLKEAAKCVAKTTAQGLDYYYARGLFWTAYVTYKDPSLKAIGSAVLCNLPKVGPIASFLFIAKNELWDGDEIPIEQHVSNCCALFNLSAEGIQRLRSKPTERAIVEKGVNEGGVPKKVAELLNQKSFQVKREWEEGGRKYAKIEVVIMGLLDANGKVLPPRVFEKEVHVVSSDGKSRFFDRATHEPIIPHGEEGYHAWSHLVERKCGIDTGETSLQRAFEGTPYAAPLKKIADDFSAKSSDRGLLNKEYARLMNTILDDYGKSGTAAYLDQLQRDYYYFGKLPPELKTLNRIATERPEPNFYLTVRNGRGETHIVRISLAPDGKLMNAYVMDGTRPIGEGLTKQWFDHWKPSDPRFYSHALIRNYVP